MITPKIKGIKPQGKPWTRFKRYYPAASCGVLKKNKNICYEVGDWFSGDGDVFEKTVDGLNLRAEISKDNADYLLRIYRVPNAELSDDAM